MKLIVGLGNPGPRYHGTRHNVGFEVVDELARRRDLVFTSAPAEALIAQVRRVEGHLMLAKPLTSMNVSGQAVAALQRYYRVDLDHVLIVAEDVNLPLGRLRTRARGSDGGHNGVRSVIDALGTAEFARMRVGVGRGDPRRDLADHVLSRFEPDERPDIAAAIARAADAVDMFVAEGIDRVMASFNRKDPGAPREDDEQES